MKIVIRVDAANDIGRGHATRCLSLADGLRRWGNEPVFICRELPGDLIALMRSRGYTVYSFSEGDDAEQTLSVLGALGSVHTLIVDHYGLDIAWEKKIRKAVPRLVVLDDLANREHAANVLLDPSLGRNAEEYKAFVSSDCQLLLGTGYALLSEPYSRWRYPSLVRREKTKVIERLLVSMGGTDPVNATGLIMDALAHVDGSLSVDVVVGSAWPQLASIEEKAASSQHKITLHRDVSNLAALMSAADVAIGAGGVTAYERCCMALPSILLVIADNQFNNAQVLHQKNAAIFLGRASVLAVDAIANALNELMNSLIKWRSISDAAAMVCDGYGVNRIAAQLLSEPNALMLRPASFSDSELMYQWQQDPSTRQYARNTDIPTRRQHEQWLKQRLANPNCLFNIMTVGNEPVGVLRFDRMLDKENTFEISILVVPEHRKNGYAAKALNLSRKIFPNIDFYAEVHDENKASHQLFLSTGYVFEKIGYFNREVVYEN